MQYDFVISNLSAEKKEIVLFSDEKLTSLNKKASLPSDELCITCNQMPYAEFKNLWAKCGFVKSFSISPFLSWSIQSEDSTGYFATVKLPYNEPKGIFRIDSYTCIFFEMEANTEIKIQLDYEPREQ